MIDFNAEHLIPGHSRPLQGKALIKEVLSDYKDAIFFVLEETLKGINAGKTPDELVEEVKLPDDLATKPYLQEFYGTVEWSIRSIFTGYLGWFDGNPTTLFQPTTKEESEGMLALAGSVERIQEELESHSKAKNYPWALKLADVLSELNAEGASLIKAKLLREFAEEQLNATARNYFISYAKELENV